MLDDTPILLADSSTKPFVQLQVGDELYGTVTRGDYRRYMKTRAHYVWRAVDPVYRIEMSDGTWIVASKDQQFLTQRGWKHVTGTEQGTSRRPHLTPANRLLGTCRFATPPEHTEDYRRGYLCGMIRGDGLLASYAYTRLGCTHGNQYHFRLALTDSDALYRTSKYLLDFGVRVC